jgi:dihydrofolate synthase / folylpolyglutamate synthase
MHLNPAIAAALDGLNNPSLPGIDLSLVRMRKLLATLGNPERKLAPVIHLAGTNGKGSTLAFLRAIYEASGYRVHAYTSPHLVTFNERIVIAGNVISDAYLLTLLERVSEAAGSVPVTFFEATTAVAFLAFAEHSADVVLLETGLGGRLDATNVVPNPLATVITPIDYDHMEFLGDTLAAIAGEKAGIIKPGAHCFVGAQQAEAREVLKRTARTHGVRLCLHGHDWRYDAKPTTIMVMSGTDRWELPFPALVGAHQHHNAALASVVAHGLPALPVTNEAFEKAMHTVHWPARLQKLTQGPLVAAWGERGAVMLDGGHNPHAAQTLRQWMDTQTNPVTLLCGMMRRKDAAGFLAPLVDRIDQFIAVPIADNDSFNPQELLSTAQSLGIQNLSAAPSLSQAQAYFSGENGCLLIAGSLFLAGEVLKNHS